MIIRAAVISALEEYLAATYHGPIQILKECSTETLSPPYAVVRIGTSNQLYPGQVEIWECNILIGVFHDADSSTAATAEAQSGDIFSVFYDPQPFFDSCQKLAWSAMDYEMIEASMVESRWQHVAAFKGIVAEN